MAALTQFKEQLDMDLAHILVVLLLLLLFLLSCQIKTFMDHRRPGVHYHRNFIKTIAKKKKKNVSLEICWLSTHYSRGFLHIQGGG